MRPSWLEESPLAVCLEIGVALAAVLILAGPGMIGCTCDTESRRALVSQGFTDIQLGGYAWFSCSDSDGFSNTFSAVNAKGQRVSGVVCCGVWKSCTVRW